MERKTPPVKSSLPSFHTNASSPPPPRARCGQFAPQDCAPWLAVRAARMKRRAARRRRIALLVIPHRLYLKTQEPTPINVVALPPPRQPWTEAR